MHETESRQNRHPPLEIPMFDVAESLAIEILFESNGIDYRKGTIQLGASMTGGSHAYTFHVTLEQFGSAIDLLKQHFGLEGESAYSGVCPACGTEVLDEPRCDECGLNLSEDRTEAMSAHPLVIFLRKWSLL